MIRWESPHLLVRDGALRSQIDTVYGLRDIATAHAHVEGGRTVGKVVVQISG